MSDMYDDGLEPSQDQPQATGNGFEALPAETQAEIKKLRQENQSLRNRAKESESAVLTAKYGDEIVELIPPEVTDPERRAELAEMFMARLASSSTQTQAPVAPEETAAEPPTPAEQQLATASGGPATGTSLPASDVTDAEILKIGKTDPQRAAELIQAKHGERATPNEVNPYIRPVG